MNDYRQPNIAKPESHRTKSPGMVETTTTYLKEDKLHLEAMLSGIADGVISVDRTK